MHRRAFEYRIPRDYKNNLLRPRESTKNRHLNVVLLCLQLHTIGRSAGAKRRFARLTEKLQDNTRDPTVLAYIT